MKRGSHATKKRRRRPERPLTDEEVAALQARGRKAAADGLLGFMLDDQLKNERLSRTEHHIVRIAFNDALEGIEHSSNHSTKKQLDHEIAQSLVDTIRPGSRVTIVNRFGQQSTGKAVMRGPYGWVLNMGGSHGTPAIASADNTVAVRGGR